jgi:hypothetical protein
MRISVGPESPGHSSPVAIAREPGAENTARVSQTPDHDLVPFEPILADNPGSGIADELNRISERPEIRPSPTRNHLARFREGELPGAPMTNPARTEPRPPRITQSHSGDLPGANLPADSLSQSLEWNLLAELYRVTQTARVNGGVSVAETSPGRQHEASDANDDVYEENPDPYEPLMGELSSTAQPGNLPPAAHSRFEPIERPGDFVSGIADELNRLAEGTGIPAEPANPANPAPPEPIVVAADCQSGIAYELNRASEGLQSIPPDVSRIRPDQEVAFDVPPADPMRNQRPAAEIGLEDAIRLTRDAARAWMNVLTGPTLVRMTAR